MSDLPTALWISLLGILLTFIGILLLWGMMELLVRITSPREKKPTQRSEDPLEDHKELQRKQQVVAVAVAAAMMLQDARKVSAPSTRREVLSPWQSVHRLQGNQTTKKNWK